MKDRGEVKDPSDYKYSWKHSWIKRRLAHEAFDNIRIMFWGMKWALLRYIYREDAACNNALAHLRMAVWGFAFVRDLKICRMLLSETPKSWRLHVYFFFDLYFFIFSFSRFVIFFSFIYLFILRGHEIVQNGNPFFSIFTSVSNCPVWWTNF